MAVIKKLNSRANIKQSTAADINLPQSVVGKILALYDAIVGSISQVNAGVATHSSLTSAMVSLPAGGNILILEGTFTENPIVTNSSYKIEGQGHLTIISGNLTINGNYNDVLSFKVTGNVGLSGNNNFLKLWQSSSGSFTDSGLANDNRISQE